jgi:hypothetical protein
MKNLIERYYLEIFSKKSLTKSNCKEKNLEIILEKKPQNFEKNILRLIIFELKFVDENSTQNIFENYQKICVEKNIKFDKNLIIELIKTIREYEF